MHGKNSESISLNMRILSGLLRLQKWIYSFQLLPSYRCMLCYKIRSACLLSLTESYLCCDFLILYIGNKAMVYVLRCQFFVHSKVALVNIRSNNSVTGKNGSKYQLCRCFFYPCVCADEHMHLKWTRMEIMVFVGLLPWLEHYFRKIWRWLYLVIILTHNFYQFIS
jgi:hypothetical protein